MGGRDHLRREARFWVVALVLVAFYLLVNR